jgi:hypothetical protein
MSTNKFMTINGGFRTATTLALCLLPLVTGCRTIHGTDRDLERVDWEFIQSAGGISIGNPYIDRASNFLVIPINQDFSGNRTITIAPTLRNSGLLCAQIVNSGMRINHFAGATEIAVIASAAPASTTPTNACNEVSVNLNVPFFLIFRARVVYEDPGFRYFRKTHFIGEFSL